MVRRVLEPSEEVKRLTHFSAVVETPSHSWEVFEARLNMVGAFLENRAPFVLR